MNFIAHKFHTREPFCSNLGMPTHSKWDQRIENCTKTTLVEKLGVVNLIFTMDYNEINPVK